MVNVIDSYYFLCKYVYMMTVLDRGSLRIPKVKKYVYDGVWTFPFVAERN